MPSGSHCTATSLANDQAVLNALQLRPWRVDQLAGELGLSEKTVFVSFNRLRDRGIPVAIIGEEELGRSGQSVIRKSLYRIAMPKGRVCSCAWCDTLLRTTNPSDRCELHGGGVLEIVAVMA